MAFKKQVEAMYAGALTPWGDEHLDEMVARASVPKARQPKAAPQIATTCPGCGREAILHKGHVAILCQECHDDITERAKKKPGLSYEPAFVGY